MTKQYTADVHIPTRTIRVKRNGTIVLELEDNEASALLYDLEQSTTKLSRTVPDWHWEVVPTGGDFGDGGLWLKVYAPNGLIVGQEYFETEEREAARNKGIDLANKFRIRFKK